MQQIDGTSSSWNTDLELASAVLPASTGCGILHQTGLDLRALSSDWDQKFLRTLQASTAPHYIRTCTPRPASLIYLLPVIVRQIADGGEKSFINWRGLVRVLWSRFGLPLSGWSCNPAAEALSSPYIIEKAQPDSSALRITAAARITPTQLLQQRKYHDSWWLFVMYHDNL